MPARLAAPRPITCPGCREPFPSETRTEFRHSRWPTWRCPNCHLVFVWPLPSEDLLRKTYDFNEYAQVFYGENTQSAKKRMRIFSSLFDKIRETGIVAGRLLDYGCSNGLGIRAALTYGWDPIGVERDPETSAKTQRQLGVPIYTALTLSEVPDIGKFRLAVLSHVLEHVLSPRDLLNFIRERLSNPGYVLIRVPNERSLASRALGSLWSWYCPPVHLYYFDETSISTLLHGTGFRILWTSASRGDALPLYLELLGAPARALVEVGGQFFQGDNLERPTAAIRSAGFRKWRDSLGEGVGLTPERFGDEELAVLAQVV